MRVSLPSTRASISWVVITCQGIVRGVFHGFFHPFMHSFIHSFIHSFHKHLPSTRTHAWTCPTWAQHVSKRVLALLSAACSQEALGVEGRNENINTQRRTRLPRAGRDRRRRRGSHSCKRRPPDEGVPASVKMPLPCAPASFVLGCQATPQPPGRAPLPT